MKSPKTKAGKRTTGPDDVGQLTRKLAAWARKLPKKQQTLLSRLVSRCNARVPVGVLCYGETEFYDCLVSARNAFTGWGYGFKVVSCKQICEAHDLLYTFFKNSDYEILVKVDADIVLSEELSSVVRAFSESGEKHWALNAWDCYTRQFIPAVHVFRSAFNFSGHSEVNTDAFTAPVDRGMTDRRLAEHGSALNPFEQFRTGLHRAGRQQRYATPFLESYFERAKSVANKWLAAGRDCAPACPVKFDYGASEIAQMFAELRTSRSTSLNSAAKAGSAGRSTNDAPFHAKAPRFSCSLASCAGLKRSSNGHEVRS